MNEFTRMLCMLVNLLAVSAATGFLIGDAIKTDVDSTLFTFKCAISALGPPVTLYIVLMMVSLRNK